MSSCCENKSCDLEKISKSQSKVLWTVLVINLVMFVFELGAGIYSDSLALTGDSLDMLGDAIAYGSSLYVLNLGLVAKARSARLKAWIILASTVGILGAAIYRTFFVSVPAVEVMSATAIAALIANLVCLALLTRHKNDDVNMSSVWICSRNDIIANTSVLGAAGLVWWTGSPWPDLVIGLGLTYLFVRSALHIFAQSKSEVLQSAAL